MHLSNMLAKLYRKQLAEVKVAGTLGIRLGLSEWFRIKKRVRQGSILSSYLFNILAMVLK